MAIKQQTLIPETIDVAYSEAQSPVMSLSIVATVALVDDETITIQQSGNGSMWYNLKLNGVVQALTKDHTIITVSGPGLFRIKKSATSIAVGVIGYYDSSSR